MALINATTKLTLASSVELAQTGPQRRRGLLGRDRMAEGSAMVITRCNAVHTIGMRFPIDVAFVDSRGRVKKVVEDLAPWRIALSPFATTVIEFRLLRAMVERLGEVVTHEELLAAGWPDVPDPAPEWLKPHMARLREKLVSVGAPVPVAVRGVGYRLDA